MTDTYRYPRAKLDEKVLADARRILVVSPIAVRGFDGTGEPQLDLGGGIRLNGDAASGHDCETFHLPGTGWDFWAYPDSACTTNGMPYADVVTAILISTFVHQGAVFTSDGRWSDWDEGLRLFESAVRPLEPDERFTLEMAAEGLLATSEVPVAELWPDE